jgi:hypothetical protein
VTVTVLLYCNIIEIREVSIYHTSDKPKQPEEEVEIDFQDRLANSTGKSSCPFISLFCFYLHFYPYLWYKLFVKCRIF